MKSPHKRSFTPLRFASPKECPPLPWSRGVLLVLRLGDAHYVNWNGKCSGGEYRPTGCIACFGVYGTIVTMVFACMVAVVMPEARAYLLSRDYASDELIRIEVDTLISAIFVLRLLGTMTCMAMLQRKRAILAELLNDLSRLWISVGQPPLRLSSAAFILSLLCMTQIVYGLIATVIEFPQILPIQNRYIVYSFSLVQGYIYGVVSTAPVIIFIFMALVYGSLVDCFDVLLLELPLSSLPVSFVMDFFEDVRRILSRIACVASPVGLAAVISTGSVALMTIFYAVIPFSRREFINWNYTEHTCAGLQFVALTAALYIGFLLDTKLLETKDLFEGPEMTHVSERHLRPLGRALRRIRHPPKAGGLFQLDLTMVLSLCGFLLSNTMVFIQFKAIMKTGNTSARCNNANSSYAKY